MYFESLELRSGGKSSIVYLLWYLVVITTFDWWELSCNTHGVLCDTF